MYAVGVQTVKNSTYNISIVVLLVIGLLLSGYSLYHSHYCKDHQLSESGY